MPFFLRLWPNAHEKGSENKNAKKSMWKYCIGFAAGISASRMCPLFRDEKKIEHVLNKLHRDYRSWKSEK